MIRRLTVGVAAIALFLSACSGSSDSGVAPKTTPTEALVATPTNEPRLAELIDRGRELADFEGCTGCHSIDGRQMIGPTWQGLYGTTVQLDSGTTAVVDDAYVTESIQMPEAKLVEGYFNVMPPFELRDEELRALIEYIKSLR